MKRMKIVAIFMVAIMVLSGCGNTKANNIETETIENNISEDVYSENTEVATDDSVESEVSNENKNLDSMIVEKDDTELNMKTYYYSIEDRTFCDNGNDVFGSVKFNGTDSLNYVTTSKVPIYAQNGIKIGYTKEDVDIIIMGTYGEWCKFYLDKDIRYARLSDIEANSITMDERDAITEETNKQEQTSINTETSVKDVPSEQPVQDTPVVTEPIETPVSDKYTPDEAITIYRGIMEGGGITWDPSLKGVTSWGTGFFYLDKGYVEWAGETNLESCAMGDSVGNPVTKYYLEVTGSDENTVYFTEWHN